MQQHGRMDDGRSQLHGRSTVVMAQPHTAWDGNDGNKWICSFQLHTFRLASKMKAKQKGVDRTQNVKYPNQPYLVES